MILAEPRPSKGKPTESPPIGRSAGEHVACRGQRQSRFGRRFVRRTSGSRCYYAAMPRLFFETDPADPSPLEFDGSSDVLVYFLSLAFSTRYGSLHPLSQLALLLRRELKVDLGPLTTFADRDIEEDADQVEFDRVWQDAAPLAATLAAVTTALASSDERIAELIADAPDLRARLADLQRMAERAAERGDRVRLSFAL